MSSGTRRTRVQVGARQCDLRGGGGGSGLTPAGECSVDVGDSHLEIEGFAVIVASDLVAIR